MYKIDAMFLHDIKQNWRVPENVARTNILILVTSGKLVYSVNQSTLLLQKGDLLYIPCGAIRSAERCGNPLHQMMSVHFIADSHDGLRNDAIGLDGDLDSARLYKPRQFDYLKQRFTLMIEHWLGGFHQRDIICLGILLEILGLLEMDRIQSRFPSKKIGLVSQIQHYIQDHYREPLTLSELAGRTDRTKNYISSAFREVTGQTPIEYMHDLRINTAHEMLANTDMTIAEIADRLGYSSPSYFNRMYKKRTGRPPSSYMASGPRYS